jgi:enoyl-CoA hydratase/carnithine racemase
MSLVNLVERGSIIELVLNRAEKRNAMHWEMMEALDEAISAVPQYSEARAVLVRGEGAGFSAGIDLMGFPEMAAKFGEAWRQNMFPVTAAYQAVLNKFERCPLPVIALLHGFCLGLGFELALACDMRIAAEGTKIGLPETRVGLTPDVGGTTRLCRLIGVGRAKEYILTGKHIPLDSAERWGIVNYVVPHDQLMTKGEELVGELAQAAPLAVRYSKQVINQLSDVERGLQLEGWAQSHLMATQDVEIGAQAMLTKQPAQWKGK